MSSNTAPIAEDNLLADDDIDGVSGNWKSIARSMIPSCISLLVHTLILLVLAVFTLENPQQQIARFIATPPPPEEEDPPVEVELDPEIKLVPDNVALFNAASAPASAAAALNVPTLDQQLVSKADVAEISISAPTIGIPDSIALIESVPDGEVKGEARDIVGSYQEAIDRLAQELIWMLDDGPVLAVWCFDQSKSMKDDQQEIRDRIKNVYEQLGLLGRSNSGAFMTAVTSYGGDFIDHTKRKPTANGDLIRKAIDSIPVDASGKEIMCSAVGRAVGTYRDLARRGRKMALILVTDESGDPENNVKYLEQALSVAKAAKCKIYVLGRESMFGYPFAYKRYLHPQTNRIHWQPMDRGPETGFPEQLQTNGFRRRSDYASSGFGPYEQTRLARETNGIFFMLPSDEDDIVGQDNRTRFDLEALRSYRPDLRSRQEVYADRNELPLRTLIWKVIQDLDPYNKSAKKTVEIKTDRFSLVPQEFVEQARQEQAKAKKQLRYMAEAEKALLDGELLREQEADPRWQANYDMMLAQLVAYQARLYEYGVALDAFIAKPKKVPMKKGETVLRDWRTHTVRQVRTEESKPYIDRATKMFKEIRKNHPRSPWATRASWELGRGYGVDVRPSYGRPYRNVKKPDPVPKI